MATTKPKARSSITIDQFLGVDFANDETNVDPRRSPNAPNMVADTAGRPQKRRGYELINDFGAEVNGIYPFAGTILVHAGTKLYAYDALAETWTTQVKSGMANARSMGAVIAGNLCIVDGSGYTVIDDTLNEVTSRFIPTTVIGRKPTGGGTFLEDPNMLTSWRINSFTTDGTAATFQLDADNLDYVTPIVSVGGVETNEFSWDYLSGTVTFDNNPPDDDGVDSVVIRFSKTISGYADMVNKCTIIATYGLGNDSRVFISGNPDHRNVDWQSGLYDPTYFPDTGYTRFGSEQTAVMGYMKQYDAMVVVKERSDTETGIFLRTAELDSDGVAVFPVKEGLAGIGAVSRYAFASLPNDQVFLTTNGLYGLDSNAVTQQRTTQLRSYFVNPSLIEEAGLQNAVGAAYKNLFILCVNGNAYVANMNAQNPNPSGSYGYEWYYWTNIPARTIQEAGGRLYFGSADGKLFAFKNTGAMTDYSDGSEGDPSDPDNYVPGEAIDAMWTTPLLDGGDFMREKTISKKGTGIKAKPFSRSSGEIFFTTDRTLMGVARQYTMDILDWDDIDFNRFTFNMTAQPQVQIAPKKYRKVLFFQMGVRNNVVNEGFGVLAMQIAFTVGNNTRRKN